MSISQKSVAWLVLASYLFANTLAASLHDHHACCGHSACAAHLPGEHDHAGHHHAGHHHTAHDCTGHDHAKGSAGHGDGSQLRTPHHCVVCEFFAQAPLTPPAAELIPGGDRPPEETSFSVLPLAHRAAGTHLPRGPPAQG